jgi:LmbE family N-acetylglucosaminyl deacetylase
VPLEPASVMFITAHLDDDEIFMQPQLVHALEAGSVTTVFVTSGDPLGKAHQRRTFEAAQTAYEHIAGDRGWLCGYTRVTDLPAHHCRLQGTAVSLVGLDLAEGGRHGELPASLLNLIARKTPVLPVIGPYPGEVTIDGLIAELAEVIATTAPDELHILDYAYHGGDDHPGHSISASFALWAVARAQYRGPIVAHRGYSVAGLPETLSDADYALAAPMVGTFDACYFGTAPCGTQAPLDKSHRDWLLRQYSTTAHTEVATGRLERGDAPGRCLAVTAGAIGLAPCDSPDAVHADPQGHLVAGARCVASGPEDDAPLALAACSDDPAQIWLIDGDGGVWSSLPPTTEPANAMDMLFDHTRCLAPAPLGAPVCGKLGQQPRWRLIP